MVRHVRHRSPFLVVQSSLRHSTTYIAAILGPESEDKAPLGGSMALGSKLEVLMVNDGPASNSNSGISEPYTAQPLKTRSAPT